MVLHRPRKSRFAGYIVTLPRHRLPAVRGGGEEYTRGQSGSNRKAQKHRFPVDFHRELELFGQHASRLKEPGYREIIARCGIIVVEGFNDVLGLDALGVPAVAIMSNKITDELVAKVERWAKQRAGGKVMLLFDADDAGDTGARKTLWLLTERN